MINTSSSTLLFVYIFFVATLGQITADLYLPSLPYIQTDLETSTNLVQLSVAIFMWGFGFTQLFFGLLSDAFGRKYILLLGLIISCMGTIIALQCQSILMLLLGRLLQGIGVASCGAISKAMLRDCCDDEKLVKISSYFTIIGVFVIASAPLLGGYIQHLFGWRTTFLVLSIYIFSFILIQIFIIKETNFFANKKHINPKVILRNLSKLINHKVFSLCCLANFLAYGGLIAWLTAGSFLVQTVYGYSPIAFGYIGACFGGCFCFGGIINSALVTSNRAPSMMIAGFIIMLLSGLLLLSSLLLHHNFIAILAPVALFFLASSLVMPNGFSLSMKPFKKIAGLAGAMLGCMQILGGAIFSSIISYAPDHNQAPLAIIYTAIGIVGIITTIVMKKNINMLRSKKRMSFK